MLDTSNLRSMSFIPKVIEDIILSYRRSLLFYENPFKYWISVPLSELRQYQLPAKKDFVQLYNTKKACHFRVLKEKLVQKYDPRYHSRGAFLFLIQAYCHPKDERVFMIIEEMYGNNLFCKYQADFLDLLLKIGINPSRFPVFHTYEHPEDERFYLAYLRSKLTDPRCKSWIVDGSEDYLLSIVKDHRNIIVFSVEHKELLSAIKDLYDDFFESEYGYGNSYSIEEELSEIERLFPEELEKSEEHRDLFIKVRKFIRSA